MVSSLDNLVINSTVLPSLELVNAIKNLSIDEVLQSGEEWLVGRISDTKIKDFMESEDLSGFKIINFTPHEKIRRVLNTYDVFSLNGSEIKSDFSALTSGRAGHKLSPTNTIVGQHPVFVEEGCDIECTIFNTKEGPIYIGKNCLIMEGSMIRGPFAMGNNAVIKMAAKIYANTTLGPGCKAGGEIQNVVFQANSNKAHDGYLGNSVIGEWCNIGAGTDNSNLKNNYEEVKLWSHAKNSFVKTGLQFCGLIMGDHSKCAIGTTFNTGTVIGVSANIFGSGFPRNFIPSFSWGGHGGFKTYAIQKAFETAERVFQRRGMDFSDVEKNILQHIFQETESTRTWE